MERAARTTSEIERLERIRRSEKEYHERCYERNGLFEPGSWLHKPVKTVTDGMQALYADDEGQEIYVLDLGCGVGRNAIPIAEALHARGESLTFYTKKINSLYEKFTIITSKKQKNQTANT